ncbi:MULTISPECIES: carbon monoxide dehydrogenase [Prosthecochloris]|uniref:Carbon monoxide dehydrogenase n=1 Tax=Prosthecochloris marina TaxID=2017681 RepID=A0A317T3B1_9CHLB|nr:MULTISPECIES: carbon monoxide dehydrogenase [Prosthecochloris]PWW81124.1 carbon monoxide dehydrogenase [Prosthecochloris marina]UZJ37675.1 carbon monoxide dehydrogenase [Prosthecochloris sp. SCSIO W1103]
MADKKKYTYEDELTGSRMAPDYTPGMPLKDRIKLVHRLNYSKEEMVKHTANKAVAEMVDFMGKHDICSTFDRFAQQHPQCGYGLTGACCAFCSYGPCRVTEKTPLTVCGKDVDLVVAGNALRRLAAGLSAHGAHAREVFISLKAAAEGIAPIPLKSREKGFAVAKLLGIETEGKAIEKICGEIADRFIDDLQRALPKEHETLKALAPKERVETWEKLDIIPISAYHECFETNNLTSHGTDSDFESHMQAFLRTVLAYSITTVVSTSLATDIVYGIPKRSTINVNLGSIVSEDCINIGINGHAPMVAFAICDIVGTPRIMEKVKKAGAKDIRLYGMCCTGGEFIERDLGIPLVAMASSAEMAVATGAFEAIVVDQQDVLPGMMPVARQFHTKVITTSPSGRKEGAIVIELDYYLKNLDKLYDLAEEILDVAIGNYQNRDPKRVYVPKVRAKVEMGFGVEEVMKLFNGSASDRKIHGLAELVKSGKIRGIVNFGSCGNIRGAVFERNQIIIAKQLIRNDVLVTCHGCSGMGLLFAGLAHSDASKLCGERLREVVEAKDIPPVLHVGACTDSTRAGQIMAFTANAAGVPNPSMPLAMVAADPAAEKTMGARYSFVLQGIETYSCVQDNTIASDRFMDYVGNRLRTMVGAGMNWDPDPYRTSEDILRMLDKKRVDLGWPVWEYTIGTKGEIEDQIPDTVEIGQNLCSIGY